MDHSSASLRSRSALTFMRAIEPLLRLLAAPILSNERHEHSDDVLGRVLLLEADGLEQASVAVHHRARAVGSGPPDFVEILRDVHHRAADAVDALHVDAFGQRPELTASKYRKRK